MDESDAIYENCAGQNETHFSHTRFTGGNVVPADAASGSPVPARYTTAQGQGTSHGMQRETVHTKQYIQSGKQDSSRVKESKLVTGVLIILCVLTLLNTAMVVWFAVSSQRAGSRPSESAPLIKTSQYFMQVSLQNLSSTLMKSIRATNLLYHYHGLMVQNLSLAIKRNAEAIAVAGVGNEEALQNISSKCNDLMTQQQAGYQSLVTAISALPRHLFVRLVNGGNQYSGRVEIYYHGNWGTICDDDWDINDATVICRMMGYSSASSAPDSAHYGQGTGSILLDDVNCQGTEYSILDCTHLPWDSDDCVHSEDASVVCNP